MPHDITIPLPPNFPVTLRRLLKIGHSHAVTLPRAWVADHCKQCPQYLTTTINQDGTLTVKPYATQH